MTDLTEDRNPIEELGEEFMDRRRSGEAVTIDQFADSHPEHAVNIRRLFPAMLALERFKSSKGLSSSRPNEARLVGLEQLGDYRIIEEIGRGGMGIVYEAEQQSLQRRVALKVFPRQVLRNSHQLDRFHREARTAGALHHTNIVPVFGVGEQDGLHYYVMQRIQGTPLNEFIDGPKRLSAAPVTKAETEPRLHATTTTRSLGGSDSGIRLGSPNPKEPATGVDQEHPVALLDLGRGGEGRRRSGWNAIAGVGIQVADALAFAHTHGVIHRDIKPSNLVLDPNGTVWVTDFGLATMLDSGQSSDGGEVAGTLRYMAPEHINGTTDARSDVYSLGLTLYELLTMQPAFDDSDRVALVSKIMAGNILPPRAFRAEIPLDLQAIVMKAIAKDPDARYESAAALATDLRRFSQDRPVHARRVNPLVKLSRWGRRNPVVASLTAALLLLAISSFAVISAKWRDAVAENRRAEENLSVALESMDQILERFTSSWMANALPEGDEGGDPDAAVDYHLAVSDHSVAVLEDALKFYDQFALYNPADPRLNHDTAKVHRRVADIYQRLGQYQQSQAAYRRSLQFLETNRVDATSEGELALQRASIHNQLGVSTLQTSRFSEAETEYRKALHILTQSPDANAPESRVERARVLTNLSKCLSLLGRLDEAESTQSRAIQLLESLVQEHSNDTSHRLELARAYRGYCFLVGFGNKPSDEHRKKEHNSMRESAVSILEQLVAEFPNVPDYQCELSDTLATTGFERTDDDEYVQCVKDLHRAVDMARDLTTSHPSIPRYRTVLGRALLSLALRRGHKNPAEAEQVFTESVELFRELTVEFADVPVYRYLIVRALHHQAHNLKKLKRYDAGHAALQEAVGQQQVYADLRPDSEYGRRRLKKLQACLSEFCE